MDILLNILVIIFAVIVFLILYYTTIKKDRENQDYQLPFRETKAEYEVGEEIGVDKKEMEHSEPEISRKEISLKKQKEKNGGNQKEVKNTDLYHLKDNNNETYIRLFSRDPNYLFTYWEVKEDEFYNNTPCLRLFNLKDNEYYDIGIDHQTENWYLHSKPDRLYKVTIGYKKEAAFFPLASSKTIKTPLDRPSDIIDEHWMTIEELSGYTYRIEMDSLELMKNIEGKKIHEELEADSFVLAEKK